MAPAGAGRRSPPRVHQRSCPCSRRIPVVSQELSQNVDENVRQWNLPLQESTKKPTA
jgi:hypothetical protein